MKNYLLFFIALFFVSKLVARHNNITCIYKDGRNLPAVKDLETFLKPYKIGNICITKVPLDGKDGQSFYLSATS